MFEDEVAEIDAMVLTPGDLCVINVANNSRKKVKKNVCLIVKVEDNKITLLKPDVGVVVIPKGWIRKIEIED